MAINKKYLFIGGAAIASFITFWAFRKKSALESLEILVNDIKLTFKSTALQANIALLVKNPSNELLQFLSFTGQVYADSQPIGNLDISKPIDIKPKDSTIIPLSAVVPVTNVASSLLSLLTTKQLPTTGVLKGTVTLTGGIQVPVYYTFNFSEPAPASSSTTTVNTKSASPAPIPNTVAKTPSVLDTLSNTLAANKKALDAKNAAQKLAAKNAKTLTKLNKKNAKVLKKLNA